MYKGWIYCFTNLINSKKYIGQTMKVKQRIAQHWSNSKDISLKKPLYLAIRKYGRKNFKIEILQTIECLEEKELWNKLNESEIYYIQKYNSLAKNGYNLTKGGEGKKGYKYTDTQKKEIGKRTKKAWQDGCFDNRDNSGKNNYWYGKKLPKYIRDKMKENHYDCLGEKNSFYGKQHTEESKTKISKSRKGKLIGKNNPSARKVINLDTGKIFETMKEAGLFYNLNSPNNISSVCKGSLKTYGGYHWDYVN